MKNTMTKIIATALIASSVSTVSVSASNWCVGGNCNMPTYHNTARIGNNVRFAVNGDTLTVYGKGDMWDFNLNYMNPAYDYKETVRHIIIEDGVTSVGDNAFNSFVNVESVVLPDSMKNIGDHAFWNCESITSLEIPSGCVLETSAFAQLTNCSWLILGEDVTIGTDAFDWLGRDTASLDVFVPDGCTLGTYSFMNANIGTVEFISDTYIPYRAFFGTDNLRTITFYYGYSADESAFDFCSATIIGDRSPIAIVSQPKNCSAKLGEIGSFHVSAQGDGLTYRWQYSYDGGRTFHNGNAPSAFTDTVSYELTTARKNFKYRCVITDAKGNTVISNEVWWN